MTPKPNTPWTNPDLPKPDPKVQLTINGPVPKGSLSPNVPRPQRSTTAPRVLR